MKRPIEDRLAAVAGEVVLDLLEALVADPDPRPVAQDEPAPEAAADEEARRVAGPGGEPGDRDQQVDVDRALAGDGAAEQHHRLAGDDEADEGAGLGEGEDADQQVGPGAERVGDVFEQALQVDVAELAADQVVADGDENRDEPDEEPFAPAAALSRQPHGALPASQTIASSRSIAAAADSRRGEAREEPERGRPGAAQRARPAPRPSRSASSASPISGRSERAAGSRSLTSSSA